MTFLHNKGTYVRKDIIWKYCVLQCQAEKQRCNRTNDNWLSHVTEMSFKGDMLDEAESCYNPQFLFVMIVQQEPDWWQSD